MLKQKNCAAELGTPVFSNLDFQVLLEIAGNNLVDISYKTISAIFISFIPRYIAFRLSFFFPYLVFVDYKSSTFSQFFEQL